MVTTTGVEMGTKSDDIIRTTQDLQGLLDDFRTRVEEFEFQLVFSEMLMSSTIKQTNLVQAIPKQAELIDDAKNAAQEAHRHFYSANVITGPNGEHKGIRVKVTQSMRDELKSLSIRSTEAESSSEDILSKFATALYEEAAGRFVELRDVRNGSTSILDDLKIQVYENKTGKKTKHFTVQRAGKYEAHVGNTDVEVFETWAKENCPGLYEDATSDDEFCKMTRKQMNGLFKDARTEFREARTEALDARVDMLRPLFKTRQQAEDGPKRWLANSLNTMLEKAEAGKVRAWNRLTSGYLKRMASECANDVESDASFYMKYFAAENVEYDEFCTTIQSMFEGEGTSMSVIDSFML